MGETFKSGKSTVEVEQPALLRALDRVANGAPSSFVKRATKELTVIERGAVLRWPRATGKSAEAFHVRSQITPAAVEVDLVNAARSARFGAYALRIRFSVRTKSSLDAEAARKAAASKSPAGQSFAFWRKRLTRTHGTGAPDARTAGKKPWLMLVRSPGKKAAKVLITDLRTDINRLARLS